MPKYIKPLIGTLRASITHLSETYQAKDAIRAQQLRLIAELETVDDKDEDVILGGLICVLEEIENEYAKSYVNTNPKLAYSFFGMVRTGSELYGVLLKMLEITDDNPLDDKHRLVLLRHYEQYANKHRIKISSDHESKEPVYAARRAHAAAKTVIDRSKMIIDLLLKRAPAAKNLFEGFAGFMDEYRKRCATETSTRAWIGSYVGLGGHKRDADIQFLEKLQEKSRNHATDKKQSGSQSDSALESKSLQISESKPTTKPEDILHLDYDTSYGILLMFMSKVKASYPVSAPTNSVFYQECQRVLNLDDPNELDIHFQKQRLSAILAWISQIAGQKDKLAQWNDDTFNAENFFDELQDTVTNQLFDLQNSKKDELPGVLNSLTDNIVLCATQYGVGFAIAGTLKQFIFNQLTLGQMAGMIAPEYAVVMAIMFMLQNPIKSTVLSIAATPLNPIVSTLLKKPIQFTYRTISSRINFRANLAAMMEKPEDNPEWIHTLLDATEDLFPQKKKDKLRYIVDIEEMDHTVRQRQEMELEESLGSGMSLSR